MGFPLLLAGPILRRVEPALVSVWVALRDPSSVRVLVWEGRAESGRPTPLAASPDTHTVRGEGGQAVGVSRRNYAALALVLLAFPSGWTPSTKPMPARTSGRRCAPSSRRHRACAMSRSL
jgi:hypothetical protein